jgi:hypothetical protein
MQIYSLTSIIKLKKNLSAASGHLEYRETAVPSIHTNLHLQAFSKVIETDVFLLGCHG